MFVVCGEREGKGGGVGARASWFVLTHPAAHASGAGVSRCDRRAGVPLARPATPGECVQFWDGFKTRTWAWLTCPWGCCCWGLSQPCCLRGWAQCESREMTASLLRFVRTVPSLTCTCPTPALKCAGCPPA